MNAKFYEAQEEYIRKAIEALGGKATYSQLMHFGYTLGTLEQLEIIKENLEDNPEETNYTLVNPTVPLLFPRLDSIDIEFPAPPK